MPLLDSALAFALTMLALATVVTVAVSIAQDLARMRARGFRRMLERLYIENFRREVGEVSEAVEARVREKATRFIDSLAHNPAIGEVGKKLAEMGLGESTVTQLDREQFLARLRDSEIGREIEESLGERSEEVLQRLGARYDAAASAASELFSRKSRWLSIGLGLAVAFAFNVDSLRLLDTYLESDEARSQILSQQQLIVGTYEEAAAKAAAGEAAAPDPEKSARQIKEIAAILEKPRLPIGWRHFPACPETSSDPRCLASHGAIVKVKGEATWETNASWNGLFFTWLAGVLSTGLLVGLGSPFWFDVVSGIASAARRLRGGQTGGGSEKTQPAPAAPSGPAPPSPSPPPRRGRKLLDEGREARP